MNMTRTVHQSATILRLWLPVLAPLLAILFVAAPASAQDPNGFRGLPSMVCADRRTSPICKDAKHQGGSKMEALQAALPASPLVPMVACDIPGGDGPCSRAACGDKVCAFGEIGQCPIDCPVPAKVDLCLCDQPGTPCRAYRIACDEAGCTSAPLPAAGAVCSCSAPDGARECRQETDTVCQTMRFSAPISGCELVKRSLSAKAAVERCTNLACPPASFGLVEQELPVAEKTRVESVK